MLKDNDSLQNEGKQKSYSAKTNETFSIQKVIRNFFFIREDKGIRDALLNHKENCSPQAVQGMWQAYGQIRAARLTRRGVLCATGIFGTGLYIFQQYLSMQAKELQNREDAFKKTKISYEELVEKFKKTTRENKILAQEFAFADATVKKICPDEKCYQEYIEAKANKPGI